jgi:hypothetical protein
MQPSLFIHGFKLGLKPNVKDKIFSYILVRLLDRAASFERLLSHQTKGLTIQRFKTLLALKYFFNYF